MSTARRIDPTTGAAQAARIATVHGGQRAEAGLCTGCDHGLDAGERFVHLKGVRYHAECLKREAAWNAEQRDPARELVVPGRAASYSSEYLESLPAEVAKLARSQHWADVRPEKSGRAIGYAQKPQRIAGAATRSLEVLLDGGADYADERLDPASEPAPRLSERGAFLYPLARDIERALLERLTPEEHAVWAVVYVDRVTTKRAALQILGIRASSLQERRAYVADQLDAVLEEFHADIRDAWQHASRLR